MADHSVASWESAGAVGSRSVSTVAVSRWLVQWALTTLVATVLATVFDAILIQLGHAYFTGGFLARDYVTSPSEVAGFIVGSLCSDAAVTGLLTAIGLWAFGRLRVPRAVAIGGAVAFALAPVVVSNVVEYELVTYLGDAFDFRLLFDLAGRSPGEILAVSSAHAGRIVVLSVGAVVAGVACVWLLFRFVPSRGTPVERMPSRRCLAFPAALLLVALIGTTVLRSGSDVLDNGLRRKPTARALDAMVEAATDVDRDGYGILGRPDDPDLLDARVHPYALDIPGDGVDEDGVGGDLPAGPPYSEALIGAAPWESRQDVVLVVLESFRADARGATIGGRPVTPVLDALAAQGIAPALAYSHNGYTVQSRRHIFSGSTADLRQRETLIDDFKRHGYQVAYFSGQDDAFGGPQGSVGFERADVAYDARSDRERRYSDFSTAGSLAVPLDVLDERIGEFLDRRRTEQPLFLYVNFHDTHFPYHHRNIRPLVSSEVVPQVEITPDRAGTVRAMYLNTASNVDRAIGDVLARVRHALGREPGVIVLSDHGESLFDEGMLGHGYALNDAQTKIPLIVANLPLTVRVPFGQADLREEINRALERLAAPARRPTVVEDDEKSIFQYLGLISRPVQIALTRATGRTIYDFRDRRVKVGGDPWRRPDELSPSDHLEFLRLVQTWERMMLARRAGE